MKLTLLPRPWKLRVAAFIAAAGFSINCAAVTAAQAAIQPANGFASEGDSISVTWAGNYTGIYANSHPKVRHCGLASGGGIDAIAARADQVLACHPAVLTILVGAHGLAERAGTDYFLRKLFAYSDGLAPEASRSLSPRSFPNIIPKIRHMMRFSASGARKPTRLSERRSAPTSMP